ncbi:MAG: hypothetical protein HKL82_09915 [Acidimicrobiaceae bacterium]|nr:hypothetical protein [Acidimicrobiaceae bacterium]NNN16156.1 hypothetical protein [Acidimicrobiaceae bacterium]
MTSESPFEINVTRIPSTGDYADFEVVVEQNGGSKTFDVSISGTLQAIWKVQTVEAVKLLAHPIGNYASTQEDQQSEKYRFTSNNSEGTLEATLAHIEKLGPGKFRDG